VCGWVRTERHIGDMILIASNRTLGFSLPPTRGKGIFGRSNQNTHTHALHIYIYTACLYIHALTAQRPVSVVLLRRSSSTRRPGLANRQEAVREERENKVRFKTRGASVPSSMPAHWSPPGRYWICMAKAVVGYTVVTTRAQPALAATASPYQATHIYIHTYLCTCAHTGLHSHMMI